MKIDFFGVCSIFKVFGFAYNMPKKYCSLISLLAKTQMRSKEWTFLFYFWNMTWEESFKEYNIYLLLERGLSSNSIEAYVGDIKKLHAYGLDNKMENLDSILLCDLSGFLGYAHDLGLKPTSQARMVSSFKSFFSFLHMNAFITSNPSELLEAPKTGRKLPDTLNHLEVEMIISQIDLSLPDGERNKAIIETLYGCGLRVSELTGLQISNMVFREGFIRVTGKGNKQRLVPIGEAAIKQIIIYKENVRSKQNIDPSSIDILFLNRRGKGLSRVMIYTIVKKLGEQAGIKKNISPHTFRHSFATELIERGASLRAVQQMLGHESITTTEIYTHLDREYLRDTIMMYHPRHKLK